MIAAQPSRTALAAAMYRAAHQVLDGGRVFADPYAEPILDAQSRAHLVGWAEPRATMRFFIAVRSMICDSRMEEAVARGVRQVVVLGAGLDTLALRDPFPEATIFEVDHPATQAWKQQRLAEGGLELGPNTRFVPVDFETQQLGAELDAAGFDAGAPAFFAWLGVVPYLTEAAVFETLGYIAGVPGAEAVFDYPNPAAQLSPRARAYHEARAAKVAALGEPFLSSFDSAELAQRLSAMGAIEVDDVGPQRIATLLGVAPRGPSDAGGHVAYVRWPQK